MATTSRFVLAALLTLACTSAAPERIDAVRVFEGVKELLHSQRFREIKSVYSAADGTIWVVTVDRGDRERRPTWHIRHLDGEGAALGNDLSLSPPSGALGFGSVQPVGTLADGSLVIDVTQLYPEDAQRLVKLNPNGAVGLTRVLPAHGPHEPFVFVDRDGVAHLILARGDDYMQVNMAAEGQPVVRTLDYQKPFKALASAPPYLRWGPYGVSLVSFGFYSEGLGRMLAATLARDDSLSRYHIYRVRSKTLALIDSGSVHRTKDVYRSWIGPVIPRVMLVPAGSSGYWLYVPTNDTPPFPTVVVYRVGPDLKVLRPALVETSVVQPLSASPPGAVVVIRTSLDHSDRREKLKLEFIAFGADGQLYTQTLEDSLTSRVTK